MVAEDIPVETYTWRELNAWSRVESGVDVLSAEVKSLDGVVGHNGAVVVSNHIGTQTVGKLEVACNCPLVLEICANLAVCNLSARVRVTVVTKGKAG